MTLSEKLERSVVVKTIEMPNSYFGIKPKEKRIKKYILFILLAAFTIATKFVFRKSTNIDYSLIFLAINLVALGIITILDGHQRKLNHLRMYKFFNFIQKLCKVIIFIFSFMVAYQFFDAFYMETQNQRFFEFLGKTLFKGDWNAYFDAHGFTHGGDFIVVNGERLQYSDVQIKLVMLFVSIITVVPAVLFFLSTNLVIIGRIIAFAIIAVIPIYNIYYFFTWFFSTNVYFYHYIPKEGNKYFTIVEKRKIVQDRSEVRMHQILWHLFVVALVVGMGIIVYLFAKGTFFK